MAVNVSVALPSGPNHVYETVEQVVAVLGAGCSFRMILNGYQPIVGMHQPFDCSIVQVELTDFKPLRESLGINRVSVILCRDVDTAIHKVTHGMVASMMSELELERISAQCPGDDLVSKADSHQRVASEQQSDGLFEVRKMRWISWTWRQ